MAAPEAPGRQRQTLHDDINELESLLVDRPAAQAAGQIPVLDELAAAEERDADDMSAADAGIDPRQLAEIARRLEQRLEAELTDLAGAIKGVVKRCILDELRTHLRPAGSAAPGAAGTEHAAAPADPERPPAPHDRHGPD